MAAHQPPDFDPGDRECLEHARRKGSIVARLYKEGERDPDGWALKAHLDTMVDRGLLSHDVITGTSARMRGAEKTVTYRATTAAEVMLEAVRY